MKSLLTVSALVVGLFGLGYVFFPGRALAFLGYETDQTGRMVVQFLGALCMGYTVSLWQVRRGGREVQVLALLSGFAAMGFAFLVALLNQLAGDFGSLGWFGVGMFAMGTALFGFGWFRAAGKHLFS